MKGKFAYHQIDHSTKIVAEFNYEPTAIDDSYRSIIHSHTNRVGLRKMVSLSTLGSLQKSRSNMHRNIPVSSPSTRSQSAFKIDPELETTDIPLTSLAPNTKKKRKSPEKTTPSNPVLIDSDEEELGNTTSIPNLLEKTAASSLLSLEESPPCDSIPSPPTSQGPDKKKRKSNDGPIKDDSAASHELVVLETEVLTFDWLGLACTLTSF